MFIFAFTDRSQNAIIYEETEELDLMSTPSYTHSCYALKTDSIDKANKIRLHFWIGIKTLYL